METGGWSLEHEGCGWAGSGPPAAGEVMPTEGGQEVTGPSEDTLRVLMEEGLPPRLEGPQGTRRCPSLSSTVGKPTRFPLRPFRHSASWRNPQWCHFTGPSHSARESSSTFFPEPASGSHGQSFPACSPNALLTFPAAWTDSLSL